MATYRNRSKLSDPTSGAPISGLDFAYIRTRNRLAAFGAVHAEFDRSGLSQGDLAYRMGKDRGWLSRLLGAPGNWTLDTVAELLWAISGARLVFTLDYPLTKPPKNDVAPHWEAMLETKPPEATSSVLVRKTNRELEAVR